MTFINAFLNMFGFFIELSFFRFVVAIVCFLCGWFLVSEIVGYLIKPDSEFD